MRSSRCLVSCAEMAKAGDFDAYVIACFDDTGLDAARCATDAPVIGIGEAAFHLATLVAGKFSVVTTLARSVPAIEHNLSNTDFPRAAPRSERRDIPVLDLELPGSDARTRSRPRSPGCCRRQGRGNRSRLRRHGRPGRAPVARAWRSGARRCRLRGQAWPKPSWAWV